MKGCAMRSRPLILWSLRALLMSAFIVLITGFAFAETPPGTLYLVKDKALLENCTYSPGTTLTNIQGQGNLVLRFKILKDTYEYPLGKVNIAGITSDTSGQVLSGSLNIPTASINDLAGSGVSIDAVNGSVVAKSVAGKWVAEFTFNSAIEVPFKDGRGNPFNADFQTGKTTLSIDSLVLLLSMRQEVNLRGSWLAHYLRIRSRIRGISSPSA